MQHRLGCGVRNTGCMLVDRRASDDRHGLERAMQEMRIELLQGMPIFGGIRADTLHFLLAFCPIVSVPMSEFTSARADAIRNFFAGAAC